MKKLFALILASFMFFVLAACGGNEAAPEKNGGGDSSKPVVIKFSHVTSPESVKGQAADKFAELVKEKTGGKAVVEVYPSSQLYGDVDELDALVSGNVHMIAPSVTKMVKLDPRWQYVDMPFLFNDSAQVQKFFDSDVAESLLNSDQLATNDIMGMAFWQNGFKNFTNSKQALVVPADFKGLKFRSQAGKVLEAQFKALGAGSATIPFSETYAALQQGTVDGQENTFNNIDTQKYEEVQKYLTVSNHGRIDYAIFVNKSFWESMPEDVKPQVEEALAEATDYANQLADKENQASFDKLKANGKIEITELTEDQRNTLRETLAPVYEEFETVITEELIEGIKAIQ